MRSAALHIALVNLYAHLFVIVAKVYRRQGWRSTDSSTQLEQEIPHKITYDHELYTVNINRELKLLEDETHAQVSRYLQWKHGEMLENIMRDQVVLSKRIDALSADKVQKIEANTIEAMRKQLKL